MRVSRLLSELAIARADGRYPKRLESITKTEALVMDNWELTPFSAENRHDLLEVIEDRRGVRSTVVTSQLSVDKWHDVGGDKTDKRSAACCRGEPDPRRSSRTDDDLPSNGIPSQPAVAGETPAVL